MISNKSAKKYGIPYTGPFLIKQYWTNHTVILQCGAMRIYHNMCQIKSHTSDTNVEDINPETND